MRHCERCGNRRVLHINAKVNDSCAVEYGDGDNAQVGYLPEGFPLADGDYLDFYLCLECGHAWRSPYPVTDGETAVLAMPQVAALEVVRKTPKKAR